MKNKIEIYRKEAGLTQKEVAERLKLNSVSTVSMWETGERMPRTDKLVPLAKLFGCTVDELLEKYKPE